MTKLDSFVWYLWNLSSDSVKNLSFLIDIGASSHDGDLVTCYGCGGTGDVDCDYCGGSGEVDCGTCDGRTIVPKEYIKYDLPIYTTRFISFQKLDYEDLDEYIDSPIDSFHSQNEEKKYFLWVRDTEYESIDRYWLDDFIELDDWNVEQFAEEESERRVEDMDEDDVIDEAGYDDKDSFEEKISELESKIEEMESERDDLEVELLDLDEEEDGDEMDEIEERIEDLEYEISDKESEKEDIESELDSLYDTAREELLETYKENTIDEINSQGVDYFIDNLGYSLEDAVTSFCTFDEDGLRESLADNEDRGNTLSPYDAEENEEEYDGEWYYIYRID